MRKIVVFILLGTLLYADDNSGTTCAEFLKLNTSARYSSLAGAGSGDVSPDANSIWLNPATVAPLIHREISISHTYYFQDISYDWVALLYPVKNAGVFGISALGLYTTVQGMEDATTSKNFGVYNYCGMFTYSRHFSRHILAGMSIKTIKMKIASVSSQGFPVCFDAGILLDKFIGSLSLGVSIHNAGESRIKFVSEKNKLPQFLQAGVDYTIKPSIYHRIKILADVKFYNDDPVSGHFGFDYTYNDALSLRAGIKTDTISDLNFNSGITFGAGIKVSSFYIDYAYLNFSDIGNSHQFSITKKF